jgi:site-specific DNA recombinase
MRATIYCRYSTDKQRESSIEDQARVCQRRADLEGLDVVSQHADDGISGTVPVDSRPGGKALLADALAGRFDVLLLEGLDRLSRDMIDCETIVRRLEHSGIRIVGVSDGYDTQTGAGMRKLQRGMRGLVNEIYLDDLRTKTHRGQSGNVDRGFLAGGASIGYRIERVEGGSRLVIDPEAAAVVRWIFERYAEGWTTQRIAHDLNARGVPPPRRGASWAHTAIYGNPGQGTGILHNEIYTGRYIWNRSQWIKDPDTGRRQRRVRPESEWKVREMPELRIVPDDLWQAVRRRFAAPRLHGGQAGKGQKPRTMFAGMLRCGLCGGPVIAVNALKYGCAHRKDRGPAVCAGIMIPREETNKRLLGIVRDELLSPAALAEVQTQVAQLVAGLRKQATRSQGKAQERLAALDGEIERLADAIASMGHSDALLGKLKRLEAEKRALAAAPVEESVAVAAITDAIARYKRMLLDLEAALSHDMDRARTLLAELLGRVTLSRDETGVWAELETETARLLVGNGPLAGVSGNGCGGRI